MQLVSVITYPLDSAIQHLNWGLILYFQCYFCQKGEDAHERKAQTAGAYPGFIGMKHLGVLLLPPGQDSSPSQGYPSAVYRQYPFIHLGEARQSGVKFLV